MSSTAPGRSKSCSALLRAAGQGDVAEVGKLIEEVNRESVRQSLEYGLRQALQSAAGQGHATVVKLLLERHADVEAVGSEESALRRAIKWRHHVVVRLLLASGANVEAKDAYQRTVLFRAATNADDDAVAMLLEYGADVNARDNHRRTILLHIATNKPDAITRNQHRHPTEWIYLKVVDRLLKASIDIEAKDKDGRTALHWAAATGNDKLLHNLLLGTCGRKADIRTCNQRNKTALHLAAEHNHAHIARALLQYGADPKATSDGNWTALHNAVEEGHTEMVQLLLEHKADCNAETTHAMTPLHWAAEKGHLDIVRILLSKPAVRARRHSKNSSGYSPLMLAGKNQHLAIMQLLSAFNDGRDLSELQKQACKEYHATITDFYPQKTERGRFAVFRKPCVYDLLYGSEPPEAGSDSDIGMSMIKIRLDEDSKKPSKISRAVKDVPKTAKEDPKKARPAFRWIHLPANNMAWVEALITKYFMEKGSEDVHSFRELANSLSLQHRGNTDHSQYMKPSCERIPPRKEIPDSADKFTAEFDKMNDFDVISQEARDNQSTITPLVNVETADRSMNGVTPKQISRRKNFSEIQSSVQEEPPDRRIAKQRSPKSPRQKRRGQKTDVPPSLSVESTAVHEERETKALPPQIHQAEQKTTGSTRFGYITLFMPYLHFETDKCREQMNAAIKKAFARRDERKGSIFAASTDEQVKMFQDLWTRSPSHVQRYLDQAVSYSVTPKRDKDHPVHRFRYSHHTKETMTRPGLSKDEKLIYAYLLEASPLHPRRTLDQYFYSAGDTEQRDKDQVVYRYCQRHNIEPKLFMVDQLWLWVLGKDLIITCFPQRWQQPVDDEFDVMDGIIEDMYHVQVQTVYDLASRITNRCSGLFYTDRHHEKDRLLDMFETTIGDLEDKEPELTSDFNEASKQAKEWFSSQSKTTKYPKFDDYFMNIGDQMAFLAEVKDIRNELNMLSTVLEHQASILPQLKDAIIKEFGPLRTKKMELRTTFDDQVKTIDSHLKNIERMDKEADDVYQSVDQLLDLKQKYAGVFEARYAREQATSAARQGHTIMVFTIVTIVFLPMSFMAAFFAINIQEFPHAEEGSDSLALSYVSKYTFGIGLAISVPLIIGALTIDNISRFYNRFTVAKARKRDQIRDVPADSTSRLSSLHTRSQASLGHVAHGHHLMERTPSAFSKIFKATSWTRDVSDTARPNIRVPPVEHQIFPKREGPVQNGEHRRASKITWTSQTSHDLEKGRR
ncbi:hypothetical protein MMC13_005181 [Lambiella insularis]|nr:hypothetical protein [Lambiella insularis]